MAEEEKSDIVIDTLGIPIKKIKQDHQPSLLEEAEVLAKSHVPLALAIFYFLLMVLLLLLYVHQIGFFHLAGGLVVVIFLFWVALVSDHFLLYKYVSMTVLFFVYVLFFFLSLS